MNSPLKLLFSLLLLVLVPMPAFSQEYWIPCARENQTCSPPYQTDIRFGVAYWHPERQENVFEGRSAMLKGGPLPCTTAAFGQNPAPDQAKSCMYLGLWMKCADEGGRCRVPGNRTVYRYGANGSAVVLQSPDGIECSNSAFGRDPVPGVKKVCQYLLTAENLDYARNPPKPPPVPQHPHHSEPDTRPSPGNSAPLAAFQRGILAAHNKYRCRHGVPPLQWDANIAAYAQNWVNYLASRKTPALEASQSNLSSLGPLGENLHMSSEVRPEYAIAAAESWYQQHEGYAYGRKSTDLDNNSKLFFTAMIWKNVRYVGCGTANGITSCNYGPADKNACSVANMIGCFETQVRMPVRSEQECR